MLTKIDSKALDMLRREMNEALAAITAKHGVIFTIGKMSYTREGDHFHVKVEGDMPTATGRKVIPMAEKQIIHSLTGIPVEGMEDFKIVEKGKGTVWYITGYNGRAPRRPINMQSADGRNANAPEEWIKRNAVVPVG